MPTSDNARIHTSPRETPLGTQRARAFGGGKGAWWGAAKTTLFHVKHAPLNRLLLSDTKIGEHNIEQLFDINCAGQPPQSALRQAQILGRQFQRGGMLRGI